jgi:hypothetical protein
MRTKALLGLAALAATALPAMAQNVYSLNVVGYYNVPVPANQLVMIANQLNTTNNTLGSLLPAVPAGSQLYKYSGSYSIYTFDDLSGAWDDASATLNPGEGCFFRSPTATTLTFVGEVMQGSLTNTFPLNALSMRSSMVPQQGAASGLLGVPAEPGDQLYKYSAGYTLYTFDDLSGAWDPSDPTINVGEAFFFRKSPASTQSKWVRNFTVQ